MEKQKVAFITNHRTPYRKLQFEEFSKIKNIILNIFYLDKNTNGRDWVVNPISRVTEEGIYGIRLLNLIKLVQNHDVILLGGYERLQYILLSYLAKFMKKQLILIFDGVSPYKLNKDNQNKYKLLIKKLVIDKCDYIFGNGEVSRIYFNKLFGVSIDKIYNQYLTVDIESIMADFKNKEDIKREILSRYNIKRSKKVILYSGRLIKRKKVDVLIKAISKLEDINDYVLFIIGDGQEKEELIKLAKNLNVTLICTGFIKDQSELFNYYFVGDLFVLPSDNEPWGLVINEAMAAGLPVITSNACGAYLDLVKNDVNGYVFNEGDVGMLSQKINIVFKDNNNKRLGLNSLSLIKEWNFNASKESLEKLLNNISSGLNIKL